MKTEFQKKQDCAGNVLFMILIAVVLFAALSYAVMQSDRGGVNNLDGETVKLRASYLLQYATSVENAIMRLRISNRCTATETTGNQISFHIPPFTGLTSTTYFNPNAPSDFSCHVFHPNGGAISYKESPKYKDILDYDNSHMAEFGKFFYAGRTCIPGLGTSGASCWSDGIDNEHLIMYIHNINKDICLEINKKMDVPIPPDDVAYTDSGCGNFYIRFTGSYQDGVAIDTHVNPSFSKFSGKKTGCYKGNVGCVGSPGGYHFYHVLIER